ncbi:hypothetical protein LVJ94_35005 [Pendulispora rubella]|uniref:Uncharacterized protein n=1 Tax=Pendulispora rubella TaxID=2741070 RepID=A0ABZ2KYM3_9BACT
MAGTTHPPDTIARLTETPHECRCGTKALLNEIIRCDECSRRRAEPRRRTLFDADLRVTRIPKGADKFVLGIEVSAFRSIPDEFQRLARPLDLKRTFAPNSLEEQERLLVDPSTAPPRSYG